RRAGADDCHLLAGQIVLMLPARSVELGTAEGIEPRPRRIARDVEEPDPADEHVAFVDAAVVELNLPDMPLVVPGPRLAGDPEAQVRPEAELVDRLLEVLLQLGLTRVRARPVVRLEREAVEVRTDVDFRTGVRVVVPRSPDAERRLVHGKGLDARA